MAAVLVRDDERISLSLDLLQQLNKFQFMSFLNIQKFQLIFQKKLHHTHLQSLFKSFEKKYKTSFNFDSYVNVIERINKTNKRETQKNNFQLAYREEDKTESFVFGEFKIFTWVLVVYCNNHGLSLEQLNHQHFLDLQSIFQSKSLIFIKYQTLCLIHQKQKFQKEWTPTEIELLTSIITFKNTPNQWRIISFELFKQSQGDFYRPFQQCREKWFNYLDPKVNRGEWNDEEDIALLTAAEFLGCKWAVISRQLGGVRTQHMVKNRYKSLISKWKKKFKKTNPQKLASYILKQLRKKNEKIEESAPQNSGQQSQSQIVSEESLPLNLVKQQQIQIVKEQAPSVPPSFFVSQIKEEMIEEEEQQEEQFDLGLDNIKEEKEWKVDNPPSEEKLLINYMRYRADSFEWQPEEKEQRKTQDNIEEKAEPKNQPQKKGEEDLICAFQNYNIFDFYNQNEPQYKGWHSPSQYWVIQNGEESELFRNLQQRNNLSWMEESN